MFAINCDIGCRVFRSNSKDQDMAENSTTDVALEPSLIIVGDHIVYPIQYTGVLSQKDPLFVGPALYQLLI